MNNKTFLLIANGELDCRQLRQLSQEPVDQIVATDGGALQALGCGILPHVVIGDLDSGGQFLQDKLTETRFIRRPSQNMNDLEKALIYCQEQQAQSLIILGVTGGRLDHTINNISVLARYDTQFNMEIHDRYSRIFLVRKMFEYAGEQGQNVSLLPAGKVEGITTRGLKYSLQNEILEFGVREGLSNIITQNPIKITIESGLLLVFVNRTDKVPKETK
ncbi:MAG: thiamine diphosphokinase [Calditrichia bacterium]